MATQLGIYNDALRICRDRKLATLTDNVKSRRLLDDAWIDANGYCLEQGEWNHAMRAMQIENSPSISPGFGYLCAFSKPEDWVRTSAVAMDSYFNVPLTAYTEEGLFWYADADLIYVRYISNDNSYGGLGNIANWPVTYAKFQAAYLAREIAPDLTDGDKIIDRAEKLMEKFKKEATANNAMNLPTTFLPEGAWVRSRYGRLNGRQDRGNINQLYG